MKLKFKAVKPDGSSWEHMMEWPEKDISLPKEGLNYTHTEIGSQTVKRTEWDINENEPMFVVYLGTSEVNKAYVHLALAVTIENDEYEEEIWEKVIKWPAENKIPQAGDTLYLSPKFSKVEIDEVLKDTLRETATWTIKLSALDWDGEYDNSPDNQRGWLTNQGFVCTY